MASVQQGEKQLFEKFWKGTFKAVATPRPESIIVASITARRTLSNHSPSDRAVFIVVTICWELVQQHFVNAPVSSPDGQKESGEPGKCLAVCADTSSCQAYNADERKMELTDVTEKTSDRNGCIKPRDRKHTSHRRSRSLPVADDLSPRPAPKGKKKKKKSERKKRKRSPSYSLSPVRKKKKKSSKKRKRNRSSSKKRRHNSSSPKSKRKDERKHKKRSRSHTHRRHHRRRSESESSAWRSSSNDSRYRYRSAERSASRTSDRSHVSRETTQTTQTPADQSSSCYFPYYQVSKKWSGADLFTTKEINHDILSHQNKGPQDYDSGNDTSSPPSTKTGLARSEGDEEKKSLYQVELPSPKKLRFTDADNASDSGNSITSYSSVCKTLTLGTSPPNSLVNGKTKRELMSPSLGTAAVDEHKPSGNSPSQTHLPRGCSRMRSRSSRSRSCSSRSSSHSSHSSPRYSRSRSLSSGKRSYSRSPSYSVKSSWRRSQSSRSSRSPSYSRYSPDRDREREREHKKYSSCEKESKRARERRRRRSYSPLRKRRRDSPSHLEARRITSARKRPIPYYRPSPSSSSRSSSCSSWRSAFSRDRSRARSRSKSRSRSYSTYRSHSRSPSWSTLGRSHRSSRSRSYDSVGSYGRVRR
ncbi:SRRM4 protein, partial [Atractosteus spatula]|nr:SRRM4 protein [Atractosteus spatula]